MAASFVAGKMPTLNVLDVFGAPPRGSTAISTESVRQWRLASDGSSFVPRTSSATCTSTYSASSDQASFAQPDASAGEVGSSPSHLRLRSSCGPEYSPLPSAPSTVGAAVACGTVVTGTRLSAAGWTSCPAPLVVVTVTG